MFKSIKTNLRWLWRVVFRGNLQPEPTATPVEPAPIATISADNEPAEIVSESPAIQEDEPIIIESMETAEPTQPEPIAPPAPLPPPPPQIKILVRLERVKTAGKTTLGVLYYRPTIYDEFRKVCYILEDQIRPFPQKVPKETAIWEGVYPLRERREGRIYNTYRQKFPGHGAMVEIANIHNFRFVMFHIGNTVLDTEGCPLTGLRYQLVAGQYKLLQSTKAYLEHAYPVLLKAAKDGGYLEVVNRITP